MKRLGSAALLALALSACDPGDPNGRNGVLQFRQVPYPVSVGQTGTMEIPDVFAIGPYWEGKGLIYHRKKTVRHDFAGTTLEVTVGAGATVLDTGIQDGDWLVAFRCDGAADPAFRVRVMAGAAVRYQDEYHLVCR